MANPAGGRGTERVNISKAGVRVGSRPALNLLEGTNVTITVADDAADDTLDVTIASSGGGVSDHALLTNVTATQHHSNANDHAQSHSHASHTGVGADDHHTQAHGNADHTVTGTPGNSAPGDVAGQGSSASVPRLDHLHGREAFGTTTQAVGTAAGGSATTPSKSDHVHASGAGTPSTSALADVAATGTGPAAAMTDHKHARESSGTTAAAIGTSAGGSATTPSKSDHVHATGAGTPSIQAFGDAAAIGTGPAASMTDHKHAMPANPVPAFATPGVTTPAALSAAGVATTIPRSDHGHQSPGGVSAIVATPGTFGAVETVIDKFQFPANLFLAGTTIYVEAWGTVSATAAGTVLARIRIGTNGTTADTQACASTALGAATAAVGWHLEGNLTVRTTGSGGTCIANLALGVAGTTILTLQSATVAVNTTVANFIDMTLIGGGTTPVVTVLQTLISVVKM